MPGRREARPQRRVSPFRAFPPQQRPSSRGGKTQPDERPRGNERSGESARQGHTLGNETLAAVRRTAAAAKRSGASQRCDLVPASVTLLRSSVRCCASCSSVRQRASLGQRPIRVARR